MVPWSFECTGAEEEVQLQHWRLAAVLIGGTGKLRLSCLFFRWVLYYRTHDADCSSMWCASISRNRTRGPCMGSVPFALDGLSRVLFVKHCSFRTYCSNKTVLCYEKISRQGSPRTTTRPISKSMMAPLLVCSSCWCSYGDHVRPGSWWDKRFVSSSFDATSSFENVVEDMLSLYKRVTDED